MFQKYIYVDLLFDIGCWFCFTYVSGMESIPIFSVNKNTIVYITFIVTTCELKIFRLTL